MKSKKLTQKSSNPESGVILPIVIILALALTITGLAFLNAGVMENRLVRREIDKNQAFWLAEAGIERLAVRLYAGEHQSIKETPLISRPEDQGGPYRPAVGKHDEPLTLGDGEKYWVEYYDGDPSTVPPTLPWAISIGQTIKGAEVTAEKKIKVTLPFLLDAYQYSIYAAHTFPGNWALELEGTGEPERDGRYEHGGKDTVYGDIYSNADVHLYEQASVIEPEWRPDDPDWAPVPEWETWNPPPPWPLPNKYEVLGAIDYTFPHEVIKHPDPGFGGWALNFNPNVDPIAYPDLIGMGYAEKAAAEYAAYENADETAQENWPWTYCDLGKVFDGENVPPPGFLREDHPLYNVVARNVGRHNERYWNGWRWVTGEFNRIAEYESTEGVDDYFFRPARIREVGDSYTAPTPLDLGENRVYYVDGDVWFHSSPTYGFEVSGKALIVATGDIHICDNIKYADDESLLALVALGKDHDESGMPQSGGDIYFGDPRFGTTYTVSAFMFSARDFLYNVDSVHEEDFQIPDTGFNVFGNWVALNNVSIMRDWYKVPGTRHWESGKGWVWDWAPAYFDPEEEKWFYFDPEEGVDYDPRVRGGPGWKAFAKFEEGKWKYLQGEEWEDLEDPQTFKHLNETIKDLDLLKHYQMKVTYDERIRVPETQPFGLPEGYGSGSIFAGFTDWQEIQ